MGWFETIQGDGFPGTLNVESEVLVRARENFVWAIIGMLKWFPDGVVADKNMCTSAKAVTGIDRVGVRFQRCFQLAMEMFYQSVGDGVVGSCADSLGTE